MNSKLLEVAFSAIVLAAIPYSIGFFYCNAYFSYFGFTLSELELSEREIFIASISALAEIAQSSVTGVDWNRLLPASFLGLAALLILISEYRKAILRALMQNIFVAGVLTLVVVWFAVIVLGVSSGSRAAQRDFQTLPFLYIVDLRKITTPVDSVQQLDSGMLFSGRRDRIVYANKSMLFLVRQERRNAVPIAIRVPKSESTLAISPMSWSRK